MTCSSQKTTHSRTWLIRSSDVYEYPHGYTLAGKIEPAASHGISHPSGEAGFSQALALALLSIIMYKKNMDRDKYQRDGHRVHLIVSHLIWCPRRRKPILVGKLKERCQQLIEEQCREKGWLILE